MSHGSFLLGRASGDREEVEITAIALEWSQIWFTADISGPREEEDFRGLDILAPDGSLVYRDEMVQLYCRTLVDIEYFTITYSLLVPSLELRRGNKGAVRERQRRKTAAEAWEG